MKSEIPPVAHVGIGGLVLGDDDDVRATDVVRWVLTGCLLVTPGHHEAYVHHVVHGIAVNRCPQCRFDPGPVHPDVEVDGGSAGEETVEMAVEVGEPAVVQPDALPHAVTDQKARIEDRDLRFMAREELPVDVDLDRLVALVGERLMRAAGHRRHVRPVQGWRGEPGGGCRIGGVLC